MSGSKMVKDTHKKCILVSHVQTEYPLQVSRLDWVDAVWPRELRDAQTDPTNDLRRMMYPKVQK